MVNYKSVGLGIFITMLLAGYIGSLCNHFTYGVVVTTFFLLVIAIGIGADWEKRDPS